MIIGFGCTKNLYDKLIVTIYSLLKYNKKVKKLYLMVENDNIEDIPNLNKILQKYNTECIIINYNKYMNKYIDKNNINIKNEFGPFALCRFILADFIKEDKYLYLDIDIVVKADIYRLWNYEIENYYIAGTLDYGVMEEEEYYPKLNLKENKYVNSGVLLINARAFREKFLISKIIRELESNTFEYPDQDAINIVCEGHILLIPSMYNARLNVTKEVVIQRLIKIYHYAGPKKNWIVDHFYCELWYEEEEELYNYLNNIN